MIDDPIKGLAAAELVAPEILLFVNGSQEFWGMPPMPRVAIDGLQAEFLKSENDECQHLHHSYIIEK
jgi:hypothetical protein